MSRKDDPFSTSPIRKSDTLRDGSETGIKKSEPRINKQRHLVSESPALSHTGTDKTNNKKTQHSETNQTEQTQALPLLTQGQISTHGGCLLLPRMTHATITVKPHSHIAEGEGQRVYGRVDLSEHLPLVVLIHFLEVHTCQR